MENWRGKTDCEGDNKELMFENNYKHKKKDRDLPRKQKGNAKKKKVFAE